MGAIKLKDFRLGLPILSVFGTNIVATFSNGTQKSVAMVGMTANTLYMIYYRASIGDLTISNTVNSIGPAGQTTWFLVGAFYASGATTLGSFVNIDGAPQTEWIAYTASLGVSVTELLSWWRRVGPNIEGHGSAKFSAVAGGNGVTIPFNTTMLSTTKHIVGTYVRLPASGQQILPTSHRGILFRSGGSNMIGATVYAAGDAGANLGEYGWDSFMAITDRIAWHFEGAPISGWSNTPLKDL